MNILFILRAQNISNFEWTEFMGRVVIASGIVVSKHKVVKFKEWPIPKTFRMYKTPLDHITTTVISFSYLHA